MAVRVIETGDRFRTALREIAGKLNTHAVLSVGFPEGGATYPDGTPVAKIAAIQEFGAPAAGIPPRPFFRTAIRENESYWSEALASLLKHNDYDVKKALQGLGLVMVQDIQQSIVDLNAPPLSPVTLMLRMMKALNTDNPFNADKTPRKRRVAGDGFKITGATVGIAERLVKKGYQASGVSTKPLIDTDVMRSAVTFRIDT